MCRSANDAPDANSFSPYAVTRMLLDTLSFVERMRRMRRLSSPVVSTSFFQSHSLNGANYEDVFSVVDTCHTS